MTARARGAVAVVALLGGLGLSACTASSPIPSPSGTNPPPPAGTSPATPASRTASDSPSASEPEEPIPEPTTTNTLPPPPAATAAAPSTAGRLTADSLPVPEGWKTIARPGGDEEGFRGNGTWVHARDPRYAAQAAITVGCRDITRDDYTDPTAALEGNYEDAEGEPGVALLLDFADASDAVRWFDLYQLQVQACSKVDEPVRTTIVPTETGLADRRRYPDGTWLEVVKQSGSTVTLIILSDPGQRITAVGASRLLAKIGS